MKIFDDLERINVRLPSDVKEWYRIESNRHGSTMSALMAFVLVNYKEQKSSTKALEELSKQSEGVTAQEILKGLQAITESFRAVSEKGVQQ